MPCTNVFLSFNPSLPYAHTQWSLSTLLYNAHDIYLETSTIIPRPPNSLCTYFGCYVSNYAEHFYTFSDGSFTLLTDPTSSLSNLSPFLLFSSHLHNSFLQLLLHQFRWRAFFMLHTHHHGVHSQRHTGSIVQFILHSDLWDMGGSKCTYISLIKLTLLLTCVLESGPTHGRVPSRRYLARSWFILWASIRVSGIISSVSSVA